MWKKRTPLLVTFHTLYSVLLCTLCTPYFLCTFSFTLLLFFSVLLLLICTHTPYPLSYHAHPVRVPASLGLVCVRLLRLLRLLVILVALIKLSNNRYFFLAEDARGSMRLYWNNNTSAGRVKDDTRSIEFSTITQVFHYIYSVYTRSILESLFSLY